MGEIVFLDWKLGIFAFVIGIISLFLFYKSFGFGQKFVFFAELQKVFGTGKWIVSGYVFLSCILIAIFSVIIANPNFTFTQTQTSKSGIDIVLVLDLSYSMLAEDIAPNRLEKSKAVLQDFIGKIQSDRVGMVIFAGKPFASFPLTHDYAFVNKYVSRISIPGTISNEITSDGTNIGDALFLASTLFKKNEREKVIILLSDGRPDSQDPKYNDRMWLIKKSIQYLKSEKIKTYTIGIGNSDVKMMLFGTQKDVSFDKEALENLKTISSVTGGEYFSASDEDSFDSVFNKLNLLTKKDIIISETSLYSGAYKEIWYFGFFVFFIFFLYFSWFYIKN